MLCYFENLKKSIETSGKQYDLIKIEEAYRIAEQAHEGQLRVSGEPYICHPVAVATILVELGMDSESIMAALLHDVVEDTDITLEQVKKKFGTDVAQMVDGVTKMGLVPLHTREEQQAENVRKMLLATAKDVRVVIIKLADRLHNMRTIDVKEEQKQRDTARETMEVYAPIAHRLGIRAVKEELEDLSLKYLDPISYQEIEQSLNKKKEERDHFLQTIKEKIGDRLEKENHIEPHIEGRVKSFYGIYRKVYMQGRNFDEIFDVYAVRIIVDTVIECYNILGIIHDMFRPLPNRFKDYISTPKQNMYQSLHTTVIDKEAIPFEVQIRTWDMHHTAEYGIAAHWKYKAGIQGKDKLEERLAWVRQLLEAQQESEDVEDIVRNIKSDLSGEEVFVFTPKGDVVSLPLGSNVIDFAYAIHSAVGNRMTGAKVNGRIVPLDHQVKTGEVIDIITTNAQGAGPNRDWLNIVKTSEARNKIRGWFKKERREENIQNGVAEIEREFKRVGIDLPDDEMEKFIADIARRQHFNQTEEFFAAIGYGGVSLSKIITRIKDDYIKTYKTTDNERIEKYLQLNQKKSKKPISGVIVEGIDGCLVKFAHCCDPVPGDDIIGFITRGYGVSIHKSDCKNIANSMDSKEQKARIVNVHWANIASESFKSTLEIMVQDKQGMLAEVSICIANMRVPIHSLNAREAGKDKLAVIQTTIGINDLAQLNLVINTLKKIDGVVSVKRTGS